MRTKLSNIRRVLLWGVGWAMGISAGWAANTQRTKAIEAIVCDTPITQVVDTLSGQEYAQVTDSLKREMKYEKRRERYMRRWMRLVPNQATLQYAGSIGLMSVGVGWHYGKNQHWETELLIGFVSRYHTESVHTTFTIKERYVPWHCSLNKHLTLQPLTTGLFFSTISGDDFWRDLPSRYPKHYYGFSTKVRTNIFVGQRLRYHIPPGKRLLHQAVSVYYELSTCDLYLASKLTNKSYPWSQTLSLAFGIRWEM